MGVVAKQKFVHFVPRDKPPKEKVCIKNLNQNRKKGKRNKIDIWVKVVR